MKKIISLLKEIVRLCESNNIKYWVVGGFAVDGKKDVFQETMET